MFLFAPLGSLMAQMSSLGTKYWHYRERFNNYFVVVGPEPGESLPMDARNTYPAVAHFGEVPVYQGYYLGMLATEYALLSRNGQNTDRTLTELYYALYALERLDKTAEQMYSNAPGELDGCLTRDDVPVNFWSANSTQLNATIQYNNPGDGTPSQDQTVMSNYIDYAVNQGGNPASDGSDLMSHDNISQLLIGLALVKKFLPNSTVYYYDYTLGQNTGFNFQDKAKVVAGRILNYMMEANWILLQPNGSPISQAYGGVATLLAYGYGMAGMYINPAIGYIPSTAAQTSWLIAELIGSGLTDRNIPLVCALAAIGDSWDGPITNTDESIASIATQDYFGQDVGKDVFFRHLHAVLHDKSIDDELRCRAFEMLELAPERGPYAYYQSPAPYGWASTRRFFEEPQHLFVGQTGGGTFNGLDYMLLFNLYNLAFVDQGSSFEHLCNTYDVMDHENDNLFTYITIAGNETNSNCAVWLNDNEFVHIKAKNRITIEPGFVASNVASFVAEVEEACTTYPADYVSRNYISGEIGNNQNISVGKNSAEASTFQIFPNPNNGQFTVSFQKEVEKIFTAKIYDILGNVVFEKSNAAWNQLNVNMSEQPKGIYFIHVTLGDKTEVQKIIIQ